ncbi:hypothetical protein PCASD_11905 [Puccinia coronata f. sp. avenae]|uniref:Uncharacterized protein n=1 Tax=Puccinia coronata f. sp. avenae TaxID=200324 RepID=A0A2N5TD26_9BASI|nr:hypothetical protein PCASD_11905 [Puccinia coronata f. sp. avenae]
MENEESVVNNEDRVDHTPGGNVVSLRRSHGISRGADLCTRLPEAQLPSFLCRLHVVDNLTLRIIFWIHGRNIGISPFGRDWDAHLHCSGTSVDWLIQKFRISYMPSHIVVTTSLPAGCIRRKGLNLNRYVYDIS